MVLKTVIFLGSYFATIRKLFYLRLKSILTCIYKKVFASEGHARYTQTHENKETDQEQTHEYINRSIRRSIWMTFLRKGIMKSEAFCLWHYQLSSLVSYLLWWTHREYHFSPWLRSLTVRTCIYFLRHQLGPVRDVADPWRWWALAASCTLDCSSAIIIIIIISSSSSSTIIIF